MFSLQHVVLVFFSYFPARSWNNLRVDLKLNTSISTDEFKGIIYYVGMW